MTGLSSSRVVFIYTTVLFKLLQLIDLLCTRSSCIELLCSSVNSWSRILSAPLVWPLISVSIAKCQVADRCKDHCSDSGSGSMRFNRCQNQLLGKKSQSNSGSPSFTLNSHQKLTLPLSQKIAGIFFKWVMRSYNILCYSIVIEKMFVCLQVLPERYSNVIYSLMSLIRWLQLQFESVVLFSNINHNSALIMIWSWIRR